MQDWTRKAILALMNQDKTIRSEDIRAVMRCISGSAPCEKKDWGVLGKRDLDKAMTCEAVARLLKVSCEQVVALAEKGLIERIEVGVNGETVVFSQRSVFGYQNRLVA